MSCGDRCLFVEILVASGLWGLAHVCIDFSCWGLWDSVLCIVGFGACLGKFWLLASRGFWCL